MFYELQREGGGEREWAQDVMAIIVIHAGGVFQHSSVVNADCKVLMLLFESLIYMILCSDPDTCVCLRERATSQKLTVVLWMFYL